MIINYSNRQELDKISLHDSLFEGFCYNYEKRQVTFTCKNYHIKKVYTFEFCNVILCNMQSCCFWGKGYNLYDMWLNEKPNELKNLMETQNSKPDLHMHSYLNKGIKYISIEIMVNSGDKLIVICETINFLEKIIK